VNFFSESRTYVRLGGVVENMFIHSSINESQYQVINLGAILQ